jgi:acyl carrier protein
VLFGFENRFIQGGINERGLFLDANALDPPGWKPDTSKPFFEDSFEIEPAKLQPQAHIFNDLGLDSLDTVDLVVALQKKFGVNIRDEARIRTVQTLSDLYQFVQEVKDKQGHGYGKDAINQDGQSSKVSELRFRC